MLAILVLKGGVVVSFLKLSGACMGVERGQLEPSVVDGTDEGDKCFDAAFRLERYTDTFEIV